MQNAQYAEALDDDQQGRRERERTALDQSIRLMELAAAEGASPVDVSAAIGFACKLWTLLIEDLAAPGNGLPKELKAQIVSIGIWILRELQSLRAEPGKSFDDAIAVSRAIRDGLL
jgi:flagellar protein FlaF